MTPFTPPAAPSPPPAALRDVALSRIEGMQGTLRVACALVEAGRRIDLEGLDAEAARLCIAIGIMPADVARQLRPALETLRAELDRLATTLEPPEAA